MPIATGAKFGPYEVVGHVGAGGMGEVYSARDTRLNRTVAIKILPEAMAADPMRMQRFEQEARTVAALNHPNILAVYDVGVQDGTPYLVTELLEGETLRERLDRSPLFIRKAVEIALQIAHGLAAAHERGIVHRDLKPENIFISKDGHTKLLDFGLAKANALPKATPASGYMSALTAQSVPMPTGAGVVMGTAPYMAPEQVRGEVVDYRADIFSFGAVLYEMLAGRRAFTGDSAVEVMTAVLKSDPPEIQSAQGHVPPALDRIVRHCLEKDPGERFQSARDLIFALGALSGSEPASAVRPQVEERSRWPLWLAAAAIVLLLAGIAWHYLAGHNPQQARLEFAIPVAGEVGHIALSPDGKMLAYVAVDDASTEGVIYIQQVGSSSAARLSGTEGATYPFWSPNDDYVGFFAHDKLRKISAYGGAPQVLASVGQGRGGSWSKKGVIIYAPNADGPLWRVDADGPDASPLLDKLLDPGETSRRWPVFLPDGDHFLFWSGNFKESPEDRSSGIYLSSLSEWKNKQLVVLARSNPGYAAGHLFFVDSKGALVETALDPTSGKVAGKPRIVANHVGRHPSTYWGAFSVADDATLVFHQKSGAAQSQLTWYDRSGKDLGTAGDAGILANPGISPDGNRVVFDVADPKAKNIDVWIHDLLRDTSTRFTFDPAEETTGVWSRDGTMIVYRSAANQQLLRLKNANGFQSDTGIATAPPGSADMLPNSFAPGDRELVATAQLLNGGSTLEIVSIKDGKIIPLLEGKSNKSDGQISPDGKWVAYESDETGEWEVYISPYSGGGGKLQVSRGGGREPRWRGDGQEIFYLDPKGMLVAVSVASEGSLATGAPTPLFQTHARAPISSTDFFTYDVTPDGKRFLVDRYVPPTSVPPLSIILHGTSAPVE